MVAALAPSSCITGKQCDMLVPKVKKMQVLCEQSRKSCEQVNKSCAESARICRSFDSEMLQRKLAKRSAAIHSQPCSGEFITREVGGLGSHTFIFLQNHRDPISDELPPESAKSELLKFRFLQDLIDKDGVKTLIMEGMVSSHEVGRTKEERKWVRWAKGAFERCVRKVVSVFRGRKAAPRKNEAEDVCIVNFLVKGRENDLAALLLATRPNIRIVGFENTSNDYNDVQKRLGELAAQWQQLQKGKAKAPEQQACQCGQDAGEPDFAAIKRLLETIREPDTDAADVVGRLLENIGQLLEKARESVFGAGEQEDSYKSLFLPLDPLHEWQFNALRSALKKMGISGGEKAFLEEYLKLRMKYAAMIEKGRSALAVKSAVAHSRENNAVVIGAAHELSMLREIIDYPFEKRETFHFVPYDCPANWGHVTSIKRMLEIVDAALGDKKPSK